MGLCVFWIKHGYGGEISWPCSNAAHGNRVVDSTADGLFAIKKRLGATKSSSNWASLSK